MTKKKTPQRNNKTKEAIELDDVQSSQVKGGSLPLLYQALTKNESFNSSPRDPATGLPVGKR